MNAPSDADGATPAPIAFEGFVFDPARAALFGPDGAEIALRPKSFAMLALLMANRGRVVTREALLEAVWPGVFVSDDSITQCVSEIRRALGRQGPRLLRTVPKRGYLLDFTPDAPSGPVAPEPDTLAELRSLASRPVPGLPAPIAVEPGWWATLRLPVAVLSAAVLSAVGVGVLWRPAERPAAADAAPASGVVPAAPPVAVPAPAERPERREAERLYREGRSLFNRSTPATGGWMPALSLFEQAIAADPELAAAYAYAAFSLSNTVLSRLSLDPDRDLSRAQGFAENAARIQPSLPEAHAALGGVLRLQQRHEDALTAYRRAVASDPSQWPSMANAGLMLVLLGRPAEALPLIREAMLTQPDHIFVPTWQTYLGLALLALGAEDHGAEAFQRSLVRNATAYLTYPERQLHLAAALALAGRWDDARHLAASVRATRPELTQSWFRERPLSTNPGFLAQRDGLYRGLGLAGVPEN